MYAAYRAFREPAIISDPLTPISDDFGDWDSRRLRYAIYWSFYENDAYREARSWAKRYKTDYGLYRWIRNVYNPAYRLGEFWKSHLWGGSLAAALPIETENENLIEAIETVRRWSNLQVKKDIITLYGCIFGDVFIQVVDDAEKEKVYLEIVHPGTVKEVELDPFGNIKAYTIEEERESPINKTQRVVYQEQVVRDGDEVVYQTFLDDKLFDWTGNGFAWSTPYGFVPLVMIKHNDVGLDWGWSELQALRSRIHEIDDQVSILDDYIRKLVASPNLLAGVNAPSSTPTLSRTMLTGSAEVENPYSGRDEVPNIYAPAGATSTPLVTELDVANVTEHISNLLQDIEENAPELRLSKADREGSGEKSGKAIREARRLTEGKVVQRRINYDDALVRAQQMAVAIGGFQNYFDGFGLDSFGAGALDHTIGERDVFAIDPLDQMEILEKKFTVGNFPTLTRWRELGASDEEIEQMLEDARAEDSFGMAPADVFGRGDDGQT
jgi:hypothetical protein